MGKETKIGLAVIGVLLLGFGGLLVRRVVLTDRSGVGEPELPRAAQAPAADGKPTVVMAQREPAEPERAPSGKKPWQDRPTDLRPEASGDVPRASYFPAETAPAESGQREGDASQAEQAPEDQDPAQPPLRRPGSNPFSRSVPAAGSDGRNEGTPPNRLKIDSREATAIEPPDKRPRRGAGSPLRQTSAQLPVNDADPEVAPPNELYGRDAEPGEAVITSEPPGDEPNVALPPDEDVPLDADGANRRDDIPLAAEPARTAWRGAVEPASNHAVEHVGVENGKYTVQPNDSLWIVSEKVYGTGRYFKAIYEHNRTRLPHADRLAVGTVIVVPPVAVLEQQYPALCPKQRKSALVKHRTIEASTRHRVAGSNVYVVEEGDTLFDIARYELGKASRWAEIYDLNRDALGEDFDYLQPGT
ncbi:MAG TPA: LysM peptidoglycan-binding domain-containing protein, partial [Pirellulales bacterium]|nr:LysM peptidoglycan-binding domain-containing protein [Pirellulales bacterium]